MKTIAAISTPPGSGGIAVIRLSGQDALEIAARAWKGKNLTEASSHTAHLGTLCDPNGEPIDQCVATIFRGPNSFTGENTVEFSLHGSRWIQRKAMEALLAFGATPANPGEFTQRAFINGKIDLAQAEAVADLIASSSRAAHKMALRQMDGSFSHRLEQLRSQIIELASLLELELDFSEEEVEFADRKKLRELTDTTIATISNLADTYSAGRAFKEGVPVVIAGAPNAGKSTLLNALLQTDKAIVSDIPGTTRDIVEDTIEIGGILFRFLDTAGLRETTDTIEAIGIDRAREALHKASIILWLIDPTVPLEPQWKELQAALPNISDSKIILLQTKSDIYPQPLKVPADLSELNLPALTQESKPGVGALTQESVPGVGAHNQESEPGLVALTQESEPDLGALTQESEPDLGALTQISANTGEGINSLKQALTRIATSDHDPANELIITNARHHSELTAGIEALRRVRSALDTDLSADFIAQDIREASHHLGLVTGAITTDNLLSSIFANFCIGK
ncbi:MAG: tRNA uridine-5-carboxymethylaminomethyl(34) synthesis GTPase MnmE [Bacteroidales bacterium]|nr:tRNA uridine-5-carboxymethylaminomethyl(34) synthesis GTPase MnmE [Bacteroidales bacterium]